MKVSAPLIIVVALALLIWKSRQPQFPRPKGVRLDDPFLGDF